MVITVIAMGMVQASLVEIILMVSMGHEQMPTILMPAHAGDRGALCGILGSDLKHMLIVMSLAIHVLFLSLSITQKTGKINYKIIIETMHH
jgi:hypothetical protein